MKITDIPLSVLVDNAIRRAELRREISSRGNCTQVHTTGMMGWRFVGESNFSLHPFPPYVGDMDNYYKLTEKLFGRKKEDK